MHDRVGPTGIVQGMAEPRRWVEALTAVLTARPALATAVTGRLPTGLWGVRLTLVDPGPALLQVMLVPYPDRVRMTLWISTWAACPPVDDAQWLALMTVARRLIGAAQQGDPSLVLLVLPAPRVDE